MIVEFDEEAPAGDFERYLKTGSGRRQAPTADRTPYTDSQLENRCACGRAVDMLPLHVTRGASHDHCSVDLP